MDLHETIHNRRAYRSMKPAAISGDLVRDMAEHAGLAPSCFNNQPWRFVFVYSKEMLEKLFPALSKGNAWAQSASMIVAVISRKDLDCQVKGRDYFQFDTGMAAGFLMLRATEIGLVCHPIAGYDEQMVKEILAVPGDMTVITLLIVGKITGEISPLLSEKQAQSEKNRPPRLKFEDFAFIDTYRAS
jgi:nitroreductase